MNSDTKFLRNILLPGDLDGAKRLHALADRLERAENRLEEIEADVRFGYERANVQINAPLALIQCRMDGEVAVLRDVLGRQR